MKATCRPLGHVSCHHDAVSLRRVLSQEGAGQTDVCRLRNQMTNQILPWTELLLNQPPSRESRVWQGEDNVLSAEGVGGSNKKMALRICG